jgi:hypothetical protein
MNRRAVATGKIPSDLRVGKVVKILLNPVYRRDRRERKIVFPNIYIERVWPFP